MIKFIQCYDISTKYTCPVNQKVYSIQIKPQQIYVEGAEATNYPEWGRASFYIDKCAGCGTHHDIIINEK